MVSAVLVGARRVSRADPANRSGIDDVGYRIAHRGEQPARARVEEQRFIAHHDELVEGDATGRTVGHVGRDAVDSRRDLGGSGVAVVGHETTVPFRASGHYPKLLGGSLSSRKW